MYCIGIDIGTTNCKVCLFELPSYRPAYLYRFPTPKRDHSSFVAFDEQAMWEGVRHGMREAASSIEDANAIVSVAVASVGQSIVVVDEQGRTIGPVIAWYDKITGEQAERIQRTVGRERLYGIAGIPSHSNHSLTKLLWLFAHYPNEMASAHRWMCMADYIVYRLTGKICTEHTLASRTLAFDLSRKEWSADILEALQLDIRIFPDVAASGTVIGRLLPDIGKGLGLGTHTAVVNAGHDHMAGSVCTGLHGGNELLNSTGTTEGLLALSAHPLLGAEPMETNLSNGLYVNGSDYTLYGSMPTAGYAFEWYAGLFLDDPSELNPMLERLNEAYSANPDALIERLVAFIPHLRGSGPPDRRQQAKAVLYGMTDQTKKEHILFSVIAGLCFELKGLLESMERLLQRRFDTIKVTGPASQNPLWLQLKADILGRQMTAFHQDEPVACGAAILGTAALQPAGKDYGSRGIGAASAFYRPNPSSARKMDHYYTTIYSRLQRHKRELE